MNSKVALRTEALTEKKPDLNSFFGIMVNIELNVFALFDKKAHILDIKGKVNKL